jgi:hypothetical protein
MPKTFPQYLIALVLMASPATAATASAPANTAAAANAKADVPAALQRRFAEPTKKLLASAAAAGSKRVLVVVQPAADSQPDLRRLLDDARAALVACVAAAGSEPITSPQAEAQLKFLNPRGAATQPAETERLREVLGGGGDALLHAAYTRRGESRSLRISVLNATKVFGTTVVAVDKSDLKGMPPVSDEDVAAAERAIAEAASRGVGEPALAAATAAPYANLAVVVTPQGKPFEHVAAIVRDAIVRDAVRERLAAAPAAEGGAGKVTLDASVATEAKLSPLKRGAVFTPAEAARALKGSAHQAILSVACTRAGGRTVLDAALVDDKKVVWKQTVPLDEWDLAVIPPVPLLNQQVLAFARQHLGKRVGNGECWTLAADAITAAGGERPRGYVHGRELRPGETVLPGDIMQFNSVRLENRKGWRTMGHPHHTAVIQSASGSKTYSLLHQNFGGGEEGKKVQSITINLGELTSGTVTIYRPRRSEPNAKASRRNPPAT